MQKKIIHFIQSNYLIILILFLGLSMRIYKAQELFLYSHDQDLLGWFIKDILINHNFRLIGQETSQQGVFIGPLFYYLTIPFYLVTGLDPSGGLILVAIISSLTIISFYFVFKEIWDKNAAFFAALIYSLSFSLVMTDREVVPTTPVMLWSIWFLYALHLLLKGNQKKGFILSGILVGLIWHINLGLILLSPLLIIAFIFSKKKLSAELIARFAIPAALLSAPLIIFELRHNFLQLTAILESLGSSSSINSSLVMKLNRVMQLVNTNTKTLIFGSIIDADRAMFTVTLITTFLILISKKVIKPKLSILLLLWLVIFVIFFSLNSIIVSEYYLNGMNVVWITIISLALSALYKSKNLKYLSVVFMGIFALVNIFRLKTININKSGYIQRKALVSHIKSDSISNNYPCISISYITEPGFDFGYRYLFWQEDMHVNKPISGSPVYTIVFPHSLVDSIDKSFGALGLIYPDYQKYNLSEVAETCSGENSNLTEPLFGYTN